MDKLCAMNSLWVFGKLVIYVDELVVHIYLYIYIHISRA